MKIEVKHPTVQEVFKESFYEVPAFQREYVWKKLQVNSLLTDVVNALFDENDNPTTDEYFIGSIVAYLDDQSVFQLIDGQQRLTTLFIVLCAIRDLRKSMNDPESVTFLEGMIQDQYQKPDGTTGVRLRLKPLYRDADTVLQNMASGNQTLQVKDLPQSAKNMLATYEVAADFLREKFQDVVRLRRFQAQLSLQVRLVRIQTLGVSDALHIFETINDRGVGLNALDLLKNLLFMKAGPSEFKRLTDIWEKMVNAIQKTGRDGKPLRFLRYFILANFPDARNKKNLLTENNLYDWLSSDESDLGIAEDPVGFADRLYQSALAYERFISKPDIALSNIYAISTSARQHLIVLLACQKLSSDLLCVVTLHLERLSMAYSIAKASTKVFDRIFANFAPGLRDFIVANKSSPDFKSALSDKMEGWVNEEIQPLRLRISDALDIMSLDRKLTCRFILRRLSQYVEAKAKTPLKNLPVSHFAKFEVEHILPDNPSQELRESFDKPNDYDYYKSLLGNLTLLEKPINASHGRDYFSVKRPNYNSSGLFLTKSLATSQAVGLNTSYVKTAQYFSQYSEWNSLAIESRQQEMKRLVMEMLGIPMIEDLTLINP